MVFSVLMDGINRTCRLMRDGVMQVCPVVCRTLARADVFRMNRPGVCVWD